MKIPLRLLDWHKVKKTGRGYSWSELTVVRRLPSIYDSEGIHSLLNIGFREYSNRRKRWWIDICRANQIDWHILEIFPANVESYQAQCPKEDRHRITCGDVRNIEQLFQRPFDVMMHWHGPEHLSKSDFLDTLPKMEAMTRKLLILGCPNGPEAQGAVYGNTNEMHVSFWKPAEFQALGFETEIVIEKKLGHISAFKRMHGSLK